MSVSLSLKSPATPADTCVPAATDQADPRYPLLRTLLADRQWHCEPATRERLLRLAQRLAGSRTQAAGSTAAVHEGDWSLLAHELECYLDFRRLRQLEAQLRHCQEHEFPFSRDDWQSSRQAEMALLLHLRQVRQSSYVPPAADRFRIH
jgi:hypothetical protein